MTMDTRISAIQELKVLYQVAGPGGSAPSEEDLIRSKKNQSTSGKKPAELKNKDPLQ